MFAIRPWQRNGLVIGAGVGYALALLADGSALPLQSVPDSLRVDVPAARRAVSIAASIRRDPFAPTPAPRLLSDASGATGGPGAAEESAFAPVPPGLTVPSIDAPPNDAPDVTRMLVLKATIAGPDPVAYVSDGNAMLVVRGGDAIDGKRVRSVDLRGLTFDDGTRLELPERAAAAPSAGARSGGRAERRERRSKPHPAGGSSHERSSPATAPASTAGPAAPAAFESPPAEPTPGGLPTIKPGPYPAGGRPTSDPAAPTAMPYPYPYPPH